MFNIMDRCNIYYFIKKSKNNKTLRKIYNIIIKYIIKDKNKEISKNNKDILTIQSSSVIV